MFRYVRLACAFRRCVFLVLAVLGTFPCNGVMRAANGARVGRQLEFISGLRGFASLTALYSLDKLCRVLSDLLQKCYWLSLSAALVVVVASIAPEHRNEINNS